MENPEKLNEKKLHPQHVTGWCSTMYDRIIGTYFFENTDGFTEIIREFLAITSSSAELLSPGHQDHRT